LKVVVGMGEKLRTELGIMPSTGRSTLRIFLVWSPCFPLRIQSLDSEKDMPITLSEFAGVVKKFPSGWALGMEEMCHEMMKTMGIVGFS